MINTLPKQSCPKCDSFRVYEARLDDGTMFWLSSDFQLNSKKDGDLIKARIFFCQECGAYLPSKNDILILKPEYDTFTWVDWESRGSEWTFQFWKNRNRLFEVSVSRIPPNDPEAVLDPPVAQIQPFRGNSNRSTKSLLMHH